MEAYTPKQLAEEGQAAYRKGDYQSAARLFKAAADGFLSSGDKLSGAEMANNCSVAYLQAGDGNSALNAAMGTDIVFSSLGDRKRQAMAIGNQASALEKLGKNDEALAAYEKCADLLKNLGETELRAYVCQRISSLQLKRKQYLEAFVTMRAGVQDIDKPKLSQRIMKKLMDLPFKFVR